MLFGFALDSPDIDFLNIDLLYTHLDLLYTDMPSKHFVFLQDVFSRRVEDILKTSWKTKNCYNENLLKTPLRRFEDQQMFAVTYIANPAPTMNPPPGLT